MSSSAPIHTSDTFRPLLKKLALSIAPVVAPAETQDAAIFGGPFTPKAPGDTLTDEELVSLFSHLADPEFTSATANHAQVGAALTSLRMSGLDARPHSLAMASTVFLERAIRLDTPSAKSSKEQGTSTDAEASLKNGSASVAELSQELERYEGTLDLVGTGGDGHDTFNVSTTAAIVAAGVPGVRICKHGAKASSSTSGSADLLISLSIPLLDLSPQAMRLILPDSSFAFLFAQLYHPSLAPLGPIRRALGFPTMFNVLGPLINPAKPARCILGVHSPGLGPTFADALRRRGCERAWIVCGRERLDEISCEGETDVWELRNGQIRYFTISPASFGLPSHPLTHVCSATSRENASIVLHMLSPAEETLSASPLASALSLPASLQAVPNAASKSGTSSPAAHDLPPIPAGTRLRALADYTLLQTAALLYVAGRARTLPEAAQLARTSMRSGAARAALELFRARADDEVRKEAAARTAEEQAAKERERKAREAQRIREEAELKKAGQDADADGYTYFPLPTKDANIGTD